MNTSASTAAPQTKTKIAVAIMTTLLVIGLGLFAYGIVKTTNEGFGATAGAAITLPKNAAVRMMTSLRKNLALYTTAPAGDAIYIVDPASGKILQTLAITHKN